MIKISGLYIYPIKSLGGIAVQESSLTSRGLKYDRRWMLVDEHNRFLTQREYPEMALLKTKIEGESISVFHRKHNADIIFLPLVPGSGNRQTVQVWDDSCEAIEAQPDINHWFSEKLGIVCKAVYMPDESLRPVDNRYAIESSDITSFSDAYPVLLISEASLDDLNQKLEIPIPMDRFRPNIVINGVGAFAEDKMKTFSINGLSFHGVKLCSRCVVTTTNQQTSERSKEPLKTLATYRTINGKVCFGQNVICDHAGTIKIGDEVVTAQR